VTDTVLNTRQVGGGSTIRLTRFTGHLPLGENGHVPIADGSLVGLRVAPRDVHVLPAGP
jgi:hypothetical protein